MTIAKTRLVVKWVRRDGTTLTSAYARDSRLVVYPVGEWAHARPIRFRRGYHLVAFYAWKYANSWREQEDFIHLIPYIAEGAGRVLPLPPTTWITDVWPRGTRMYKYVRLLLPMPEGFRTGTPSRADQEASAPYAQRMKLETACGPTPCEPEEVR